MSEVVKLPALIAGKRVEDAREFHHVDYTGGLRISMPAPTREDIAAALDTDRDLLKQVPTREIIRFFDAVAKAFSSPGNYWREQARKLGPRVTGYHPDLIDRDINFICGCTLQYELYDLLETDLGDPAVLDEWTRYKGTSYRAWPKGLVAHVMVGNVPLASFFTIVRSLATKNITVAKVSQRDCVIPQCFAQCMYDVDPSHPVVKALTTVYWNPESEIENMVLERANAVTVWGQAKSIDSVKARLRYGTDIIEFGPKRSLALIMDGVKDWDRVGLLMAYDIINYDQEACFSTQEAYTVTDPMPLANALAKWLAEYGKNVPPTEQTVDTHAHIQQIRMEAAAEGWQVIAPSGTEWTIIITDGPTSVTHPLARTIYIHPCESVEQVIATVDDDVQGVTVEPFERAWEVADALTGRGADRIIAVGHTGWPTEGFIHDGFHPMRRMVRWSAVERRADQGVLRFLNPEVSESVYAPWAKGEVVWNEIHRRAPYKRYDERHPPADGESSEP
ncbi:MAG: aldehyde dehydrogenase family protein [Haliangiales bacterium]